jgi:glycosyltransferase involved in cell wall biosynthesis
MILSKIVVTIGICVRNCSSIVGRAIESIMAQDYPHELIEVIFVDDGSEDETLLVIKGYASKMDMKVKIFHHEWRGLGFTRNVVVKNASGKYIIWVDGDMILPKDYVRKMVHFMEENPKVGIGGGKFSGYNGSNLISMLENIVFVAYSMKYGRKAKNLPGTGGAIYRVEAIKEVGGFDQSITGSAEDVDVALRIKSAGWLIYRDVASFDEGVEETWKALWNKYFWHGYGGHFTFHKHRDAIKIYGMIPPITFFVGFMYSLTAYKITHRKVFFLLPFHYTFKRAAWCLGFIKAHVNGYGHRNLSKSGL